VLILDVTEVAFTVKLALLDPEGTITDEGIVMAATLLPSLSATVVPPLGAGCSSLTVQIEVPGVTTVPGVQVIPAMRRGVGGARSSATVAGLAPSLAAITAVVDAVTVFAWTSNGALVDPVGIVTDAGMVIAATGVASFRAMRAPPFGAAAPKWTEQAEEAGVTIRVGVQVMPRGGGLRVNEKLAELPAKLPTTTAVADPATNPASTGKPALIAPAGTVTDDGAVTGLEPEATPKANVIALAAIADKVAVQVAVAGVNNCDGLHASVLTRTGGSIVSVPPLPVVGMPIA
jgi:hypothetical protein